MSIERNIFLYEILFRISKSGILSGAHIRNIEEIKDTETGEIVNERELDASPLDLESIEEIFGEVNSALMLSNQKLTSDLSSLNALYSSESEKLNQANTAILQKNAEIVSLSSLLSAKDTEILILKSQVAALKNNQ